MLTIARIQLALLKNDPKVSLVKDTKKRSEVWCFFARVYYENLSTTFVSCLNCKRVVRHHPKQGTGSLLRHKCSQMRKCAPFETKDMQKCAPENQAVENTEDDNDHDDDGDDGDETDSNKSGEVTKAKRTAEKPARKPRPKVESEWSDDSIYKLIELVKERRTLWDRGSVEYMLPKKSLWQEVADSFGKKYSITECKAKWATLRTTFNANLAKERDQKSGQVVDDELKIVWRFYKQMLFLKAPEVHQSLCADTDQSVLVELQSEASQTPSVMKTSAKPARKRSKLASSQFSSVSPSPLPVLKAVADQALPEISSRESKTKFEAFGEYIAKELENLPKPEAEFIQRKLNRVFLDLLDEVALKTSAKNASQAKQQLVISRVESLEASDNDTFDGFDAESFIKEEFIRDPL